MQSSKRLKKVTITDNLAHKIDKANAMVITDYRGLTTAQFNELRAKLADLSAEYQVVKNTLIKRALYNKGLAIDNDAFEGPTAILYNYDDQIAPIKALVQFSKTTKLPIVKAGYFGTDQISTGQVEMLAKLPSKEVLLGQVVGTMHAPIVNFVSVLNANMVSLLNALNAIKDKNL